MKALPPEAEYLEGLDAHFMNRGPIYAELFEVLYLCLMGASNSLKCLSLLDFASHGICT